MFRKLRIIQIQWYFTINSDKSYKLLFKYQKIFLFMLFRQALFLFIYKGIICRSLDKHVFINDFDISSSKNISNCRLYECKITFWRMLLRKFKITHFLTLVALFLFCYQVCLGMHVNILSSVSGIVIFDFWQEPKVNAKQAGLWLWKCVSGSVLYLHVIMAMSFLRGRNTIYNDW